MNYSRLLPLAVFAAVLTGVLAGGAAASYVQLSTQITSPTLVTPGATSLNISMTVKNSGDDTARSVFVTAWTTLAQASTAQEPEGDLAPNGSVSFDYGLGIPAGSQVGTQGLALITSYQDANGVQFSSITPLTYSIGQVTSSPLEVFPAQASIPQSGDGTLSLEVLNLGSTKESAEVYLVLPRELSSGTSSIAQQQVSLGPKGSATVTFPVSAGGAIAPSTYQAGVFAVTDDGSVYSTALGRPVISIVTPSSPLLYIAVGIIALGLVGLAAYYLYGRKKGKK